jgi:hypothetical protein
MTSRYAAFVRYLPRAPRRVRRAVVAIGFLGYPLLLIGYATLVVPNRLPPVVWAPFGIAGFAATIVAAFGVQSFRRRVDRGSILDEREQQLRDQAWVDAYRILVVIIWIGLIGVGLLSIADADGSLMISGTELALLVPAASLYLPLLPSAALMWREDDLPADLVDDRTAR